MVAVPDGVDIHLEVDGVSSVEVQPGGWTVTPDTRPVDLACLLELPPDAIDSITLGNIVPSSVSALPHLSVGLHRLILSWTGLTDVALPYIAQLRALTGIQSFGNEFTNEGVQQLVSLQELEYLYLEEETLDISAFDFVDRLPRLRRLGVMDVPLTEVDLARLTDRLPDVDVG